MNKQLCTKEEYEFSKEFLEALPELLEKIKKPKQKYIFKYVLPDPYLRDNFILNTQNTKIIKPLDVQIQNNDFVLWAEVELTDEENKYKMYSLWTGDIIPKDNLKYISTIQDPVSKLVYHYYIEL